MNQRHLHEHAHMLREPKASGVKHAFLETASNPNICHICRMPRMHLDHQLPTDIRREVMSPERDALRAVDGEHSHR